MIMLVVLPLCRYIDDKVNGMMTSMLTKDGAWANTIEELQQRIEDVSICGKEALEDLKQELREVWYLLNEE